MEKVIVTMVVGTSLILGGCASKLAIDHSATGNGIAVSMPKGHILTKKVESLDKNKVLCPAKTVLTRDFVNLPFGDVYTVNVDPAFFASNDFSIEFTDNGALKKVTLNSDPQIDETITATANLVKEIGTTVAAIAPALAVAGPDEASCGTFKNETLICVQTYEEWKLKPCN